MLSSFCEVGETDYDELVSVMRYYNHTRGSKTLPGSRGRRSGLREASASGATRPVPAPSRCKQSGESVVNHARRTSGRGEKIQHPGAGPPEVILVDLRLLDQLDWR